MRLVYDCTIVLSYSEYRAKWDIGEQGIRILYASTIVLAAWIIGSLTEK